MKRAHRVFFYPRLIYNLLQNKNKQCQTVLVHLQQTNEMYRDKMKWRRITPFDAADIRQKFTGIVWIIKYLKYFFLCLST